MREPCQGEAHRIANNADCLHLAEGNDGARMTKAPLRVGSTMIG